MYGTTAYILYLVLTITEMVVVKALYIFNYSRIAAMNEYFITSTLINFNVLIIGLNIVLRLTLREFEVNPWFHLYFVHYPVKRYLHFKSHILLLTL